MGLDPFLLTLLEDPVDHGPLLYVESRDLLYNPRRRVAYAVRDSIPVLLPDESRAVGDDEHQRLVEDPSARPTGEGPAATP
ncbi:MAG: Trm112 family protein [Acidimicrobiales bacterium]